MLTVSVLGDLSVSFHNYRPSTGEVFNVAIQTVCVFAVFALPDSTFGDLDLCCAVARARVGMRPELTLLD